MQRKAGSLVALILLLVLAAGCASQSNNATPVEEEQIKNLALSFFVLDSDIPAYEATIDQIENDWARVQIAPVAVDSADGAMLMYLQKQALSDDAASTQSDTGWTVVAGPQAQFTQAELDSAGVPAFIRLK